MIKVLFGVIKPNKKMDKYLYREEREANKRAMYLDSKQPWGRDSRWNADGTRKKRKSCEIMRFEIVDKAMTAMYFEREQGVNQ